MTSELDLRAYLSVFRRRRAIIAATVVLFVVLGLALAYLRMPVYTAEARVILRGRIAETASPVVVLGRDPARAMQTEIEVFKSQPIRDAVAKQLGSVPEATVRPVGQTDVISISASSAVARLAAEAANAYAVAYVDLRQQQAAADLDAAAQEVQPQIDELQGQIDEIAERIDDAPLPQRNELARALDPERDALVERQGQLTERLIQLRLETRLDGGGARVLSAAVPPQAPANASLAQHVVVALLLGLFTGLGVALLVDYFDDSIKTTSDVERLSGGVAVLAEIPIVPGWKARNRVHLESIAEPGSAVAEAYRTLRTAVQFLSVPSPIRLLQVTSAVPGEGKSTTVANLAVALASAGQRVIVVGCDLRRPRVHEFFGVANDVGFTSVLLGSTPLGGVLQRVPGVDRLRILASGPLAPNPSELLGSMRAAELFGELRGRADIVLVDSPPVLPVTDAALLGAHVDACLLTAVPGSSTAKELVRSLAILERVDVRILGFVLNGVRLDDSSVYARSTYAVSSRPEIDHSPVAYGPEGWGRSRPAAVSQVWP